MNRHTFVNQANNSLLGCFLMLATVFQAPSAAKAEDSIPSGSSVTSLKAQEPIIAKIPPKPIEKMPPLAPSIKVLKQNQARTKLQQGMEKHKSGQLAEAEELFRHAVILDPQNTDGFFNLGALAEGRGDMISALSNYRSALHIRPNDSELKQAVQSIEEQLAHTRLTPAEEAGAPLVSSADELKSSQPPQTAPPIPKNGAVISVKPPGNEPLQANVSQQSFRFSSAMNDPPILGVTAGNGRPLVGVSPRTPPAVLSVTPRTRRRMGAVAGTALGIILSVGAGYATRGALHCPVCRVLGGF